jgi:hypothetical protein
MVVVSAKTADNHYNQLNFIAFIRQQTLLVTPLRAVHDVWISLVPDFDPQLIHSSFMPEVTP